MQDGRRIPSAGLLRGWRRSPGGGGGGSSCTSETRGGLRRTSAPGLGRLWVSTPGGLRCLWAGGHEARRCLPTREGLGRRPLWGSSRWLGSPSAGPSYARVGGCAGAYHASYAEDGREKPFRAPSQADALCVAHHSAGAGLHRAAAAGACRGDGYTGAAPRHGPGTPWGVAPEGLPGWEGAMHKGWWAL